MTEGFCQRLRAALGCSGAVAAAAIFAFVSFSGAAYAQAYAAMVMDMRSGEVLHARNHDTRLHPASLTKMMTLYIAFEAVANGEISLDTMVRISRNAASEPCSCLGLREGQTIALRYLIRAAAVRSANDAATAIAEAISGSEAAFAARMNRTARAMGMNNTTFRNAHGLTHREHLSTARDMTILGRQLFFDYPQYYNLFSRRSADAGIAQVLNTNRRFLDAYNGADGIKTGYTRAAGFNLTASAERGGVRIISTVFGGASVAARNTRTAELMDMGFARAPRQVAVNRPARPRYDPSGAQTPVTITATGSVPESARTAGRTIRLHTAVTRSLRPQPRPVPEPPAEVLLALQDEIGTVLEQVQANLEEDTTLIASGAPEVLPVTPEPRPGTLLAESEDGPTESQLLAGAEAPEAEIPDLAIAEAAGFSVAASEDEQRLAAIEAGAEDLPVLATSEPADSAPQSEIPEASPFIILTSTPPPQRPMDLQEIALASTMTQPAESEIVSRLSTQGDHIWAINIGAFGTRHEAERALMQTALAEIRALDGGLRRVRHSGGQFEASFAGLSRDQADLACRRLQARGRTCFTVSP